MRIDRRFFLASLPALMAGACSSADEPDPRLPTDGDPAIIEALRPILRESGVPGLAAAVVSSSKPARIGAVGVRKAGSPEGFAAGDLVHLGSCTKAMTATMIATLVEAGKLAWTTTLAEAFPETKMDEGYKKATLIQLLSHRAGLPANGAWHALGKGRSTTDQRRELARQILPVAPKSTPGTTFLYSNGGYALAGLMAEEVTKASWDDLMRDRLFRPLGMDSAGFGAPGTPGKTDQPWGHTRRFGALVPAQADNVPALGPAGTVRCTLEDWGKFAALHLAGARGEKTPILKPETFATLHTPARGEEYVAGWGLADRGWAGGTALTHTGSNTHWFADVWLAPKKGFALLSATNDGSGPAQGAADGAIAAMIPLASKGA